MKYSEFEDIISQQRMRKYLLACNNESKRAMTLYRYNLKLSQEMFALISCFEVTLRNRIDKEMKAHFGNFTYSLTNRGQPGQIVSTIPESFWNWTISTTSVIA